MLIIRQLMSAMRDRPACDVRACARAIVRACASMCGRAKHRNIKKGILDPPP